MAEQINWAFNLQAVSGPKLSGAGTLAVEVYDKTSVSIEAGKTVDIDILPAASAEVTLVAITASQYGTATKFISYKQDSADTKPITLDAPVTLLGGGAARMFPKQLSKLSFTNGTEQTAVIEILVGRNG